MHRYFVFIAVSYHILGEPAEVKLFAVIEHAALGYTRTGVRVCLGPSLLPQRTRTTAIIFTFPSYIFSRSDS